MSFHKPPVGLPEDAKIRGSPRKDQDLRGAAILHQQRRLKQATQFVHKDSADLLPLDQLRRLGTSKDLQPHSVIQRRLLGGSPIKETSSLVPSFHLCNLGVQSTNESAKVGERIDEDFDTVQDQPTAPDTSKETPGSWAQRSLLISCKDWRASWGKINTIILTNSCGPRISSTPLRGCVRRMSLAGCLLKAMRISSPGRACKDWGKMWSQILAG
ncbi:hypothetical protein AB205_0101150 [Aquarana catesbeiana]|uniref:Nuclear receptor-interacting protein 2 n=1 Tax=Aquarana catesbeiana TaxID=8400 RepID=A0A2G9SBX5_AQUCT|nr:hypothetical protein AB205_0101150 [Aquarana catesbeiana]